MPFKLKNFAIDRVDLVDEGANQHAHVLIAKNNVDERDGEYEKANMTAGERNSLPDSAFAAVWTDKEGHKQRKLPYKRKDGSIDLGHLRNALSRIAQHPDIPEDVKAHAQSKLDAAAKEQNVGTQNKRKTARAAAMKSFMSMIAKAFGSDGQPPANDEPDDDDDEFMAEQEKAFGQQDGAMHPKAVEAMKALHDHVGKMLEQHKGADGGFGHLPAEHPAHKLAALHKSLGESLQAYGKQPGDGGLSDWEAVPDEGGPEPYGREPGNRNALTKSARAAITKANERAAKAEKDAKEAMDVAKRLQNDAAIAKARVTVAKFKSLGVDVEKDAEILKKLEESDKATYDRVLAILDGAEAVVKKADVFERQLGTERTGSGNAWAQIEALAKELVSKNVKLTKHKAIDQIMKSRKDLVEQHLAEAAAAREAATR